jgi:hypothetical protein
VAIIYSQQSSWFHGGPVEDHINGWYQALIEARIPFEMVHDRLLDLDHINQFKTLILPNITCLSDAQCGQLRAAARAGISLIATHETTLYDGSGKKRDNFALADLFGADYAGHTIARQQNAYLNLGHQTKHPLLRGLEDAPRIIHGVSRVEIKPRHNSTPSPLTLIPSYPDLPMEKVFPRTEKTNIPQVFMTEMDRTGAPPARVIYFPWDIDRTFWEVLCVDHYKLLRNAIEWATNEKPPVTVTGPGILDVTIWRQKNSITIHLVNLTNPMMMKGPIREFLPIGKQIVEITLPPNTKPKKVHLLAAETTSRPRVQGNTLKVEVPSITDHEVIAIDL